MDGYRIENSLASWIRFGTTTMTRVCVERCPGQVAESAARRRQYSADSASARVAYRFDVFTKDGPRTTTVKRLGMLAIEFGKRFSSSHIIIPRVSSANVASAASPTSRKIRSIQSQSSCRALITIVSQTVGGNTRSESTRASVSQTKSRMRKFIASPIDWSFSSSRNRLFARSRIRNRVASRRRHSSIAEKYTMAGRSLRCRDRASSAES